MVLPLPLVLGGFVAFHFCRTPPSSLPITIAQLKAPHSGLLQFAKAKGFFAQEDLDVIVKTASTGYEVISQVLDELADVGPTANTPFTQPLA